MNAVVAAPSASLVGTRHLRIAFCFESLQPLRDVVIRGMTASAEYILQGEITRELRARGHAITFVGAEGRGEVECSSDLSAVARVARTWSTSRSFEVARRGAWRVQRLLGVPYLNVFSNYRLLDACMRCLPGHDVVWERNGIYSIGVAMACKRLKLPYVMFFEADQVFEHDFMGAPIRGLLRWRANRLLQYNLEAATSIICVTEAGKAHLKATFGADPSKILVFPNAANVGRFKPDPVARRDVRATLGVDEHPVIMFVGSFGEWHDIATLIDAFSSVVGVRPDARLVLVGTGRQHQAMMDRAERLGIREAVRFMGRVPYLEVPGLLNAADVAVVPYPAMHQNLWLSPVKLFEYMASGTAVVASGAGQVAEVIEDGRNGLLVPPGDAASMAQAIRRLLEDQALRASVSTRARKDAVEKHSWARYVSRLEQLFGAVIARQDLSEI